MYTDTTALKNQLTGALIGLACTSYNHAGDDRTFDILIYNLAATNADMDLSPADLTAAIDAVHAEKNRISPGCCACMAKCGNSDDYDLARLQKEETDVRSQKVYILTKIREKSLDAMEKMIDGETLDPDTRELFRRALASISYRLDAGMLQEVIDDLRA